MSETNDRWLIDHAAAAVGAVAIKGDALEQRPILGNIAIRDGWAVAADGYVLAAVELPAAPPEAGELPLPPLLPATLVKDAMAALPRTGTGATVAPAKDGEVALAVERNDQRRVVFAEPAPAGTFPDIDEIWPQTAPQATVVVNVRRLRDLLDVIGKAGAYANEGHVALRVYGPNQALELRALNQDGRKIRAVLMPMVVSGETWDTPPPAVAWFRGTDPELTSDAETKETENDAA